MRAYCVPRIQTLLPPDSLSKDSSSVSELVEHSVSFFSVALSPSRHSVDALLPVLSSLRNPATGPSAPSGRPVSRHQSNHAGGSLRDLDARRLRHDGDWHLRRGLPRLLHQVSMSLSDGLPRAREQAVAISVQAREDEAIDRRRVVSAPLLLLGVDSRLVLSARAEQRRYRAVSSPRVLHPQRREDASRPVSRADQDERGDEAGGNGVSPDRRGSAIGVSSP